MGNITLKNVSKHFGSTIIIPGLDLVIENGEFVVFVGPSGCGKSTLLRCISGLETISSGTLAIDGRAMNDVAPSKRGIAMVFQSYALYPHMTVYDNMAYALKLMNLPKAELDQKVRAAADKLQLTKYLERLPKALSGGQRQRVAIGRAIVRDPKVFLFDEPLSNLDAALRVQMRMEIGQLKEQLPNTTMVYVTHDQVEAMTMADRIVVFNAGRIEQVGTPLELYQRPVNLFVAGFLGSPRINLLQVQASQPLPHEDLRIQLRGQGAVSLGVKSGSTAFSGQLTMGVRPEHVFLEQRPGCIGMDATFELAEHLGNAQSAYFKVEGASETWCANVSAGQALPAVGDRVTLWMDPSDIHAFNDQGHAFH